jgi:mannose-6-phosphate isomerase-like protein (cupin superfamily)
MLHLPGGCRVFSANDGLPVTKGNWTSRTLISQKSVAKFIAETINEYNTGRSPLVVNPQAEEVLYVVSGSGVCRLAGFDYGLEPGVGVYIPPDVSYSIENPGPTKLIVVGVCCPEDDTRHVGGEVPSTSAVGGQAPRRTVREQDRQPIPVGERRFKLMVNQDLGCQRVTQFIGFIPPSKAPFHYHPYEEAIFILEGAGTVHVEEGRCEFGPGTSIYLPIGLRHCLENPGTTPVRLLGAFYPSGSPSRAYES